MLKKTVVVNPDQVVVKSMITSIKSYADHLTKEFETIPEQRKMILKKISDYINRKVSEGKPANLVYICTHNSRRSHFGQIWARVAADYYHIPNIHTFSGGTEATAFNINAINALKRVGFEIEGINKDLNTKYRVTHDVNTAPTICFSKTYDDPANPKKEFAAMMTCSDAEENCPFIPGAELRVATTYDDPKAFDNKPEQELKYDERCKQIARETFYVFAELKHLLK